MNAIDTVVFDLGEVLIPWDPRRLYRRLFADEAAMERFLAQVCTPEWNGRQDAGRPLAEGTALLVAAFPEHEALIRAYYGRWEEMLGPVNEGSAALVRDLKAAGYRVLALTNWSGETFPRARRLYPVLEAFEGILVSGGGGAGQARSGHLPAALRAVLRRSRPGGVPGRQSGERGGCPGHRHARRPVPGRRPGPAGPPGPRGRLLKGKGPAPGQASL